MCLQVISDKIHTNSAITYILGDTTSVEKIYGTFDVFDPRDENTMSFLGVTLCLKILLTPFNLNYSITQKPKVWKLWRFLHLCAHLIAIVAGGLLAILNTVPEENFMKSKVTNTACSSYWLMCGTRSEGRKTPIIFILENPDVWGSHGREPKGMQRTNLLGRSSRSTIGFVSALSRSHKRPE